MSRRAPRDLTSAMAALTATLAPATTLARAQQAWEPAAGAVIAAAAVPTGERAGILTVTCSASVWAAELDLMAGELIARLNDRLGPDTILALRCITR